jgi:lysozyme
VNIIKLTIRLKNQEGLRLKPYKDTVDKLTIGYGRNLNANGISIAEADTFLDHDISTAIEAVSSRIILWHSLDDVRQRVLIEMCFNLGIDGLLKFNNFFLALHLHDYDTAAKEMLNSLWSKQVKNRAIELATMMETGKDI